MSGGYQLQLDMTIARGGCLYSTGNVSLDHVGVYACVVSSNVIAYGGAIYAARNVNLSYSVISGNSAYTSASGGLSKAGGVFAGKDFLAQFSTISGNSARGVNNAMGAIGGVLGRGNASIRYSTIAGNSALDSIGGLLLTNGGNVVISNSTISGNMATRGAIGGASLAASVAIYNSTITFNQAANTSGGTIAAGIAMTAPGGTAKLESTLIANNTYGPSMMSNDLTASGVTITGHNNLVRASSASLPADTIVNRCPLLGPLRDNGGLTKTHALLSHSPGIDQGNNAANLTYDQRGAPNARMSGPAADIGAYEVQQGDIVFNNGFDGCP
jgi:hypothetical protein